MRILIACGGTGGHITPALAIADTVRSNIPHATIAFVGTQGGMEQKLVASAGYPISALRVEGLSRSLSPHNLRVLWDAAMAVLSAKQLLRTFSPDLVIGTGGYACYPAVYAATRMGIPTAVHESNAVPGLAIRRLAGRVDRVWLNFESAANTLPAGASIMVVGNPLPVKAAGRLQKAVRQGSNGHRVLSFGGSLGATALNNAVLSLMKWEKGKTNIYHLHATGAREYERFVTGMREKGLTDVAHLNAVSFIEDMPAQMAAADLVVCRAGAMSISELAAGKKAAVLIPSPNVTGNHQYKNARMLADAGAAVLLEESAILPDELCAQVERLLGDREARMQLSRRIARFSRTDANRLIMEDIRALTCK